MVFYYLVNSALAYVQSGSQGKEGPSIVSGPPPMPTRLKRKDSSRSIVPHHLVMIGTIRLGPQIIVRRRFSHSLTHHLA